MTRFLLKILISALVIAGASELGKRSSAVAAILAALPFTSLLTLLWLYVDTGSAERVAELSHGIFWAIPPSFIFLLSLPWLLRAGVRFPVAMTLACLLMGLGYAAYAWLLPRVGIQA